MIQDRLLGLVKWTQLTRNLGIYDFADELQLLTFSLLYAFAALVMTMEYGSSPLVCYIPMSPSGQDFTTYTNDYCWAHGTISFNKDEPLPADDVEWKEMDRSRRLGQCIDFLNFTQY